MDKPLAVEGLRHLLQDLDAAQVVLDQVVVGREDARDLALGGEVGEIESVVEDLLTTDMRDVNAGGDGFDVAFETRATNYTPKKCLIHQTRLRS
jgi:hypothetical protein